MIAGVALPSTPGNFRSKASSCILLTVTVICICVLVVCGVMIVREYSLGKGYSAATCILFNMTYAQTPAKCVYCYPASKDKIKEKRKNSCEASSFPCLLLKVRYTRDGQDPKEGVMHPDSLQATGQNSQCSITKCLKNFEEAKREVEEYAHSWWQRKQQSFPCYYDTRDPSRVIVQKKYTMADVIHSMLWPSLVICVCGILFLRLEVKRRGNAFCGGPVKSAENSPSHRLYQQAGLYNKRDGNNKNHAKDVLVQIKPSSPQKVKTKAVHKKHHHKNDGLLEKSFISNSLSSIDNLCKAQPKAVENCRNGNAAHADGQNLSSSLSVDAIKYQQIKPLDLETNNRLEREYGGLEKLKFRQDSTMTTASQGSKNSTLGQETPV